MTLTVQFMTMLSMIGMGCVFGASLDTYQRFIKRTKRKGWIVFFNDILFWLLQGLAVFYILFIINQGELRFYIFIALLCGFAAYQSMLKNLYLKALEIFISFVIAIYRFIVKFVTIAIIRPIEGIITALIAVIIMLGKLILFVLKCIGKVILFLLNIIFMPIKWLFQLMWKLLPIRVKKVVEKFYRKSEGIFISIKNYVVKQFSLWMKKG